MKVFVLTAVSAAILIESALSENDYHDYSGKFISTRQRDGSIGKNRLGATEMKGERVLEVSPTCVSGANSVYANFAVEIIDPFDDNGRGCNTTTTNVTKCLFNFKEQDPTYLKQFNDECVAKDGSVVERNLSLKCNPSIGGAGGGRDFDISHYPLCRVKACSEDEVIEIFSQMMKIYESSLELTENLQCETASKTTSSATIITSKTTLITLTMVMLSGVISIF